MRRLSDRVPDEALQGLSFPFEVPVKLRLTATRGFRQGLENMVAGDGPKPGLVRERQRLRRPRTRWMPRTRLIVGAAVTTLAGTGGDVLDLGCGNGALLQRIEAATPGVVPLRHRHRPRSASSTRGWLLPVGTPTTSWPATSSTTTLSGPTGRRYALAVLMPGRLLEAGPERSAALRQRLRDRCQQVLVYAYDDWLERPGGLPGLAREAGLDPGTTPADARSAIVTIP